MSDIKATDWQQQMDFVSSRFDKYGVWVMISSNQSHVVARRPRAMAHLFTWREWLSMPAHEENPISVAIGMSGGSYS